MCRLLRSLPLRLVVLALGIALLATTGEVGAANFLEELQEARLAIGKALDLNKGVVTSQKHAALTIDQQKNKLQNLELEMQSLSKQNSETLTALEKVEKTMERLIEQMTQALGEYQVPSRLVKDKTENVERPTTPLLRSSPKQQMEETSIILDGEHLSGSSSVMPQEPRRGKKEVQLGVYLEQYNNLCDQVSQLIGVFAHNLASMDQYASEIARFKREQFDEKKAHNDEKDKSFWKRFCAPCFKWSDLKLSPQTRQILEQLDETSEQGNNIELLEMSTTNEELKRKIEKRLNKALKNLQDAYFETLDLQSRDTIQAITLEDLEKRLQELMEVLSRHQETALALQQKLEKEWSGMNVPDLMEYVGHLAQQTVNKMKILRKQQRELTFGSERSHSFSSLLAAADQLRIKLSTGLCAKLGCYDNVLALLPVQPDIKTFALKHKASVDSLFSDEEDSIIINF